MRHREIELPEADVLVHAGDFTYFGRSMADVEDFNRWLGSLSIPQRVVIAGNHETMFQQAPDRARAALSNATYLEDSEAVIDGARFYGSPWQPWFYDWAFNLPRGAPLREKWDLIPQGIDVLITHTPPHGVLDVTRGGESVGCEDLREAVRRVRPRLHVFGHIHEAHGARDLDGTRFVNASSCNHKYAPTYEPVVVEL